MKILSLKFFASFIIPLFLSNFALADGQRADDSSILDIDASGEVDAMTDGLLMMRSMFGFTDDVLVDGAVAENCTECDSEQIQEHISRVRSATIAQLNSSGEPGPEGPQGEKGEKGDAGPAGSIDFSEPSFFQNNLQVEGPFGTLLGIYFEGPPTFNDNEVGPEGLLEVASPAIFQNDLRVMPYGTLTVEGTTTLTGPTNILGPVSFGDEFQVFGTAQMGQLFVEGNLNVMGPVSFENGFQVGSNGPNGPILGAYSEFSITPNGNEVGPEGLFEVASPATFQNELRVMGTLHSDFLEVMGASLGELYVDGSARLGNGINGPVLAAYSRFSFIPNGDRAGPEGLLEVSSPATFQNDLRVMPEGTLSVEGTTTLTGPTNILGPVSLGDEFQVSGTAQMGQLFVEGNLNVMGPVSFENGFQVGSNGPNGPILGAYSEFSITPNGNEVGPEGLFEVASPATFQNELRVMGTLHSDFLEVMGASLGELYVDGSARLGNGINGPVLGAYSRFSFIPNGDRAGPEGLLEVSSPATFQNDLRVMPEGTLSVEGRLSVEGTTTLTGPTNILGPVSFGDEFQVSGTAQMDQLFVEGNLNVMGPVSFENGFQVGSNGPNGPILGAYSEFSITPNGNEVGPEGLFEVASPATFQNELRVLGSTVIENELRVMGPLRSDFLEAIGAGLEELYVASSARLGNGINGPVLGAYSEGATTFNGNEAGPEGLLEVSSPATFQNELRVMTDGTLSVEGTTTLTGPTNILGPVSFGDEFQVFGTAQMGQLFVEGNLNVMGPVSFENGFQVGSNGPNGPILGAYSEFSITPNGNEVGPEGLFEVASPATFQNELRVLGSTVIENELRVMGPLRSDFLEAIGAGLEELYVASSARLGNGINGPVLGAYSEGATTFNGNEAGPEGLLEVSSPATFQNELRVMTDGTLSVEGTTTLTGPTNILGPVSFGDEFQVSGTAQMDELFVEGNLNVVGSTNLEELYVNSSVRLGDSPDGPLLGLYREGSMSHNGNEAGPEGLLEVTSRATFQNELRVMGPLRSDYLDVMGPSSLGELYVNGSTRLGNSPDGPLFGLYPEGISHNGNEVGPEGLLEVASPATFLNEMRVLGSTVIENELRVMGPLRSDYLDVMGPTSLGELYVNGSTRLAEGPNGPLLGLYREGSVTANNIEVGLEGLLEITSPAIFQNNLEVMGSTIFKGSTAFEGSTTLMMAPDEQFSVQGTTELSELRVMGPTSIDYLDVMGSTNLEELYVNGSVRLGNNPNGPLFGLYREGSMSHNGNEAGPQGLLEVTSPTTFQNELRVMGPLRSDYLDVMGPTSLGELYVNGSTRLAEGPNGPLLGLYREGSVTANNIEVGLEGLLEVSSPAIFQNNLEVMGSTIFKGSTAFEGSTTLTLAPDELFSVSGMTELNGLRVMGPSMLAGPTSIDHLDVMGLVNLGGQLRVEGSTRLNDLEVQGMNGPLLSVYREGAITPNNIEVGAEGLLEVTSPATFQNELLVMGPSVLAGPTFIEDELHVMGPSNLGELYVNGSARLAGGPNGPLLGAYLLGSTTHNGDPVGHEGLLEVYSPATFRSNLEVMGSTTFKGLTTFEGSTTLMMAPDEQFSVQGTTELSELRVMGPTSIDYLDVMGSTNLEELYVNGSVRLGNNPNGPLFGLYPEGSMSHNGNEAGPEGLLEVTSRATFQNEVNVMGLLRSGDLDVIGQTSLGELYVNGSAHLAWGPNGPLLGAYREGSMHHNGEPVGPEGLLEVASPATFQSNLEVIGSTIFKGSTAFEGSTTLTLAPDELFSVSGVTELSDLRVMGSASIDYLDVMGSTNLGSLNVSQNATFAQDVYVANTLTAQELTQESDKRIKKDITPTKYDLKSVLKLNPVDYKLKSNNKDQTGFIAQEVRDVIPELVNGVEGDLEKGETLSINYIGLIPVLTKAIQEQQSQIDNQAATIDALLERIIALEKSNNP